MIYCCDVCHFVFERIGEVDACVDCGKPAVREATQEEKTEYYQNRNMREWSDIRFRRQTK
jgi:rRNA maturation endonuclease Nob1